MPALRQILAEHAPLILLDAASSRVQAGLLTGLSTPASWASFEEEAGTGIFRCLESLGADPAAAGAFVFCEGPGSVLGVRTTAMAIRTWCALTPRPVFAYRSLELVARVLAGPGEAVIADARRDSWHCCLSGGPVARVPTGGLEGPLLMPAGFRNWTPLPEGVRLVPYDVEKLVEGAGNAPLYRPVAEPDAFLHEEPSYAAWTPRMHGSS